MADARDLASEARVALDGITPGEWRWTNEIRQRLVVGDDEALEREIIRCAALLHPGLADARLIAAAPDLVRRMAAALEDADAALERAVELSARDILATIGHAAVAPTMQRLTDAFGLDPVPDAATLVGWDDLDDEAHTALLDFARARLGLATPSTPPSPEGATS